MAGLRKEVDAMLWAPKPNLPNVLVLIKSDDTAVDAHPHKERPVCSARFLVCVSTLWSCQLKQLSSFNHSVMIFVQSRCVVTTDADKGASARKAIYIEAHSENYYGDSKSSWCMFTSCGHSWSGALCFHYRLVLCYYHYQLPRLAKGSVLNWRQTISTWPDYFIRVNQKVVTMCCYR